MSFKFQLENRYLKIKSYGTLHEDNGLSLDLTLRVEKNLKVKP